MKVEGRRALVDFGGVRKEVSITLVPREVKPGDYVLVHAGYAIEVVNKEAAEEVWKLLKEVEVYIEEGLR